MRFRFFFLMLCTLLVLSLPARAEKIYQQNQQSDQQEIQQLTPVQQNDEQALEVFNSSVNPEFALTGKTSATSGISTVKTLVPYEDLYKVLQQDIGKYFILPIEEFEALKAAKEAWLASISRPISDPPPLLYQINSVRLEGRLEENFAYLTGQFKIETFTENWHEIPVLWGSLAVEEIKLNGNPTTLKTSWIDQNTRRVNFGKMSQQNILQTALQSAAGGSETLSQNNWKDTMFSLPIQGKGTHEVMVSFVIPIQNQDDLFTMQFNMTRIPLAFLKLKAADFILSVDNTSFKDYTISEGSGADKGCEFIGWLGANSDVQLKWRRKFSRTIAVQPEVSVISGDTAVVASASEEVDENVVDSKATITPLVYARSNTLVSLGETAIQANKVIDFTISKAPVSSFTFNVPADVEIVYVNADRPHSYRLIREGNQKRLRVEFVAGREDTCQIDISYEAPVDISSTLIGIPEVVPVNIERELGTVAVEALISVEVQPGNDDTRLLSKGVYPLDPLEAPQPLKDRATRPILLAYRQNTHPSNILLAVKRYLDVPQQTVVADSMEVKTTFTTNKTSNSLISLNIRNNNKQYLQLQLASGSEVVSAFRSGIPVKLVAGKNDGKVQIPLEMSQTVGEPLEMNLQILLKQPIDEIKWKGNLSFEPPLVDIPVSRFSWYLYSPEDYYLFNFSGTVKDSSPKKDPFIFRGFLSILKMAWSFLNSPDALFTVGFITFITLLVVSRKLLFALLGLIWNLICGIFSFLFSGKGFRLAELMIVVVIIAVLAAISIPNFRKSREQARDKACFANQRVLTGSVEMYNMDNETPMRSLNIQQLVSRSYMKSAPSSPERGCQYSFNQNGDVACRLHGSFEGDRLDSTSRSQVARQTYDESELMQEKGNVANAPAQKAKMEMADKGPSAPGANSFGMSKTKGMLPIKSKFVMTKNYYALERDLVITDIAANGALQANSTSPAVHLTYVHATALKAGEIVAFVMALFAGLYFVSGAFLGYSAKIGFAAVLVIFLSIFDLKLKSIGDSANAGLWLALTGAFIWKTIWLLSKVKLPAGDDSVPPSADLSFSTLKKPANNDTGSNSGHANVWLLLMIAVLFSLLLSVPATAADTSREIRIMAPFKELSKVIPTGERVVIIPETDYRYLKDIAEPVKPEITAPQPFRFESVNFRGTIEDRGVRFSGDFKVDLFNSGWKKVGLLSPSAIPSFASLNGTPLPMTLIEDNGTMAYGFLTNATGSVNIKVDFFIALDTSEYRHTSRFTLSTIPVCLSTIEITVNGKDCEAWIDPGVLKPSEKFADKTVFKAILPPTNVVNFELYRNVITAAEQPKTVTIEEQPSSDQPVILEEKTRITVRQHNLLYFKEGFVSGTNLYNLTIKGGSGVASLSFQLPEKIRILKVENKLIENWKSVDDASPRKLEITFKSKIRGSTEIMIEFEEDIQNLKDENYIVPEIYLSEAEQSFGILGIGCLQTLELAVAPPQGFTPIIAAEFLKDWRKERPEKTPYAFNFLRHPNHMEVTINRPEDISQQTAVIDRAEAMTLLNEDGYLLTRVVYEVKNNSQQFLKVKLPQIGSFPTELWSTQVAGLSVRAGFDAEHSAYNLPIVRSPIEGGESRAFPVEIVYAIKTGSQLQAFNRVFIELPAAHLPISELSWIVYLPEGYELMRETGNVDRRTDVAETKFLDNSSYFSSMNRMSNSQVRQKAQISQVQNKQSDRAIGTAGLLPVKFKIPTTSWKTTFSMLQIEPSGKSPYIEGMLVNPRKGKGFLFQIFMILVGIFTALSLVKLVTSTNKHRWFLALALQAAILAVAVYFKLYQADHFYQLGISTALISYLLYRYFSWKPESDKGVA